MIHHQQQLSVRTLGDFAIAYGNEPVAITWPDKATKMLFCSLLSPLDASISRERLCRALWNIPATEEASGRLDTALDQLHDTMNRTFGMNPIISSPDGIFLHSGSVYVDARDYHETAITGLRHLATGDRSTAASAFRTAVTLYRGAFLPGMTGRIITATRSELDQRFQMLLRQVKPLSVAPEPITGRRPVPFYCPG